MEAQKVISLEGGRSTEVLRVVMERVEASGRDQSLEKERRSTGYAARRVTLRNNVTSGWSETSTRINTQIKENLLWSKMTLKIWQASSQQK